MDAHVLRGAATSPAGANVIRKTLHAVLPPDAPGGRVAQHEASAYLSCRAGRMDRAVMLAIAASLSLGCGEPAAATSAPLALTSPVGVDDVSFLYPGQPSSALPTRARSESF
jgi:hypothetical protein